MERFGILLLTLSNLCSMATFLCWRFSAMAPVSRSNVSLLAAHFSANRSTDPSFHFWLFVISSFGGDGLAFGTEDFRCSIGSDFTSSVSSCLIGGAGSRISGGSGTGGGGGVLMPVRAEVRLGMEAALVMCPVVVGSLMPASTKNSWVLGS